jgi:hypothetical protein
MTKSEKCSCHPNLASDRVMSAINITKLLGSYQNEIEL